MIVFAERPYGRVCASVTVVAVLTVWVVSMAQAGGPDIIASKVEGTDAAAACAAPTWGPADGDDAYGTFGAVTVCNIGEASIPGDIGTNQHAVMAQHLYRQLNDRFEQIGMSWVKHDDWTGNSDCNGEGSCQFEENAIGAGCRDIYGVGSQLSGYLGPRWGVDAFSGSFPLDGVYDAANCNQTTDCCHHFLEPIPAGYLEVHWADLCPPEGSYFLESHFVAPLEAVYGNQFNNVSYVPVTPGWIVYANPYPNPPEPCTDCSNISECTVRFPSGGVGTVEKPAIYAWKASYGGNPPPIVETQIDVPGEGRFILGALAKLLDPECTTDCWYSYEYALYNMNSDRSAQAFRVNLPTDLTTDDIRNLGFHDVDYHDGDGYTCQGCTCSGGSNNGETCNVPAECPDPSGTCGGGTRLNFDGTDWSTTETYGTGGSLRWATSSYASDPNANALRWGTLYNFRFEAKRPPVQDCTATVTIELFKPGCPTSVTAASVVPAPSTPAACVVFAAPQAACGDPKNRVLSIVPPRCSGSTAIRVKMIDLQNPQPSNSPQFPPQDFGGYEFATCSSSSGEAVPPTPGPSPPAGQGGCVRWVGEPHTFYEYQDPPQTGPYRAARLQCTPEYFDWSGESVVHVTGAEILPSSTYEVQMIAEDCDVSVEQSYSAALMMTTARWGDVEPLFSPPSTTTQPNALDIAQVINHFKRLLGAPVHARAQLQPNLPELNQDINALDIAGCVDAVKGFAYRFSGPCPCPSTVPCGGSCTGCPGMCVKTCVGGVNAGAPCINNIHCPGSLCSAVGTCRDLCGRCKP